MVFWLAMTISMWSSGRTVFMDCSSELSGKSSKLSGRGILMDAHLSGKVMVDMCSFVVHVLAKGVHHSFDDGLIYSSRVT